jgi:CDP-glucose 4,6-dehydratase
MVETLNNFYKGKKVLITGHTGFKGAWLAIWLQKMGAKVIGYALDPPYNNGIFQLSGIQNLITDYRADIRDLNKLIEVFNDEQPEIVFHLAAQALVLESYANPINNFEVNIMGTANVLEAIRKTPSVISGIMVTTDKCYENKEWVWSYRENEPMGGHDPYSASKGAAELVISSYRASFFSKKGSPGIASARAGNVIGGGDWSEYRLVPDIMRSIKDGKNISIRNPMATRPWQYVLEPLCGYLKLGMALTESPETYAEAWNFGPYMQDIYPVKDLVNCIIDIAKQGQWDDHSDQDKLHEANLLMLDISKAIHKLKWKPTLSFNQGLELTVDWYLNAEKHNVLDFSINQIDYFQSKWK